MPVFPNPKLAYALDPVAQIGHLQQHKHTCRIPQKAQNPLLLATWNIASFADQVPLDAHLKMIAEVLSWFDFTAVQAVRENFGDPDELQKLRAGPNKLRAHWRDLR
jgi:hypothetical protein